MTEEERDAHLREALRHAPDAQVQPPPALSAFILSEARAKARDAVAPARPPRHPLATLWDWFARPSVAAGFAGVMAATLVGLMWWDQPTDEALPRRPAPVTAPAAAAVATSPPAQAPMAPPAPVPRAEPQRGAPEPPRPALRKALPAADKKADAVAPPAPPSPAPVREETVARATAGTAVAERAAAAPMPAPAALALAPEPAVADASRAPSGVIAGAPAGAMAKAKPSAEAKRLRSMAPADALSSNQAAANAEFTESRARQEAEARSSIASLRAGIAAEPARWAWQRGTGSARDMNDAVYAWLAQLEGATGSTWQARTTPEAPPPLGSELRLLRDGRAAHGLRITERGVLWESGANVWLAELPVNQLKALQAALDAAAP